MSEHPGTRVTCVDQQTGETETAVIKDDYMVIVDGTAFVSSAVTHANGTHVVTIKRDLHSPEQPVPHAGDGEGRAS